MRALAALLILCAAAPLAAQPQPAPQAEVPRADPQPLVLEAVIDSQHAGRQHVVFVLPPDYHRTTTRYPAVLAFAGLGESVRGNRAGAWGWVEKYGVVPAMSALARGQLTADDLQGLATPQEIKEYNEALRAQPWRGVVLVCPWPPNVLKDRSPSRPGYERFLMDELLPYAEQHLRLRGGPEGWGVDGISLGGLLSTHIGLTYPDRFAAIASQQGSVGSAPAHLDRLLVQHRDLLQRKALNLATSDHDPFLESVTRLHRRLDALQLPHRFTVLPGHHDKRFVRGPGSLELLLFQDRALWGSGPLPPARHPRGRAPQGKP